jgi:uncharacterized protein YbjT (DUF2867 family)
VCLSTKNKHRMTTLIVGATGRLGHATARALLAKGQPVRAMTRDPARAADLARAGAEVVVGDLTDAASLERACQGALRILASAHGLLGRGAQSSAQVDHVGHSALIAAARGAGVARLVYVSAHGARADHPVDFFRTKAEIEEVLRESTLPFTILRPTAFMENHVHEFNGKLLLERGFTVIVGPGGKPRNFVAVRDVVPFAVMALAGDTLLGRSLEIGGPEAMSNRDVALLYSVRSRQGKVRHLPLALARGLAALARPLHEGVARVLDMALVPDADWPEDFDARALRAEFPSWQPIGIDAFVDERVREWRRAGAGKRRT